MSQSTTPYHQRAPRYILLPQDHCLILVAGPRQTPWEEGTEIRDISNSGLSFTAPDILAPKKGESIRVQFTVPGAQQMACHAKVVRIDKNHPHHSLVAIEFDSMNFAQHWNLAKGLKKKNLNDHDNVIELAETDRQRRVFHSGLSSAKARSVGFGLFVSSVLLILLFRVLVEPNWMEKAVSLMTSVARLFR